MLHTSEDKQRQTGERQSQWFQPKDFAFDAKPKTCRCPAGNALKLSSAKAIIKGRRGISFEGSHAICGNHPLRSQSLHKAEVSAYRQVTFSHGSKARDSNPQDKSVIARIGSCEGRLT